MQDENRTDRISVQAVPSCCTDLIGLTLTNDAECTIDEITSSETIDLKRNFSIIIACLDIHLSLESIQETYYNFQEFSDEFDCVSRLLTNKSEKENRLIFFVVSATRGKLIVPLIHSHRCIERIYIYDDADNSQNFTWICRYTKISGSWSTLDAIRSQLTQDIEQLVTRPSQWARSQELIVELWTQKTTSADVPFIVNVNQQGFNIFQIVTLFCDGYQRFILTHNDTELPKFNNIQHCSDFLIGQEASSIFLVICGTSVNNFAHVRSSIDHSSVHAAYIFIDRDRQSISQTKQLYGSAKVSGAFTCHKQLLVQVATDICFYRQIPINIPKISLLKAESEVLAHLDKCEKEFLRYQLFIGILPASPSSTNVGSELSKFINVDDRSFINIELGQNINELFKKFDFRTILKSNAQLIHTDQEIRSLFRKTLSSSITVYRAQLISDDDLEMMRKNPNALLAIHSFIIASESYPSVIKICRRAVDNSLTVVLFEIKLFKGTSSNQISSDSDILIFPLGIVFRLKSIERTPDNVWHVQVELANFDMQHFKDQLEFKTGKILTSSTIDDYWTALDQLNTFNEECKNTMLKCALF